MSPRFNILFLALQAALVLAAGCNHDNCLRAVIASRAKPFPTVASQDCTSFFHKTVTPCPSTTTVTVTAGESGKALPRRDVELFEDTITVSPTTPPVVSTSSSAPATSSTSTPGDCENSPTSRQCWGKQSIDTNYYEEWPQTGKTREYWLSVQQGDCAPDGYKRTCMTFNGTIPGPLITADWGDNLVIHVTNNMKDNGTAIHWHGLRQLNNTEHDGVPGITQCPIPPGETLTYSFPATQYGSTWYHSHFTLQYAEGLLGPLVINGPTSANYDEDLGMLFLSDWSHVETFTLWDTAKLGAPPALENTLINGTNTFDCSGSTDPKCVGGGKKFETVFEKGKKYKIRLINVAIDGVFQFSIDGHSLTVVSADLVPMKPFAADSIVLHPAQRYDVIVEANAEPGDYWLRGGWVDACGKNKNATEMTGIVRYDAKSTATPSTTSTVVADTNCFDVPVEQLVPAFEYDVGTIGSLSATNLSFTIDGYFKWLINTSSLLLDWADPTLKIVMDGKSVFPTDYNVIPVEATAPGDWFVLVIQDTTPFGLSHPIHLHGHDSWILEQKVGKFDGTTNGFNFKNPARRDTVTLPGGGYIAIAFEIDNPGAWICHCHIAWHASEGLSLELVESEAAIPSSAGVKDWKTIGEPMCNSWAEFYKGSEFKQEDSGI
ncbi:laccase precursor [Plectosphaerella plurivora]|uniref:Laccase n=1 Tax=Plectosphaerella plurivora TaxID=936078 RepID=A0A9P8VKL8_9PEZI|nr:laccase precursor [Plectosphaerella plurivora]